MIQWTVWPRAGGPISRLSEGCRPRASGPGCCESWQVIGHAVIVITPVRFDLKSMCCILLGQPSRTSKQAFQTSLLSIYIYIYIYVRRVVLTQQVSQACLPSKSSKQVFQVYIYKSSSKSAKPFPLSHTPGVHPIPLNAQIESIKFVRLVPITTLFWQLPHAGVSAQNLLTTHHPAC